MGHIGHLVRPTRIGQSNGASADGVRQDVQVFTQVCICDHATSEVPTITSFVTSETCQSTPI
jgi:hypothetical protein